jgi:SET domain-containing protein
MNNVEPRPSAIHGIGLFAIRDFTKGEYVARYCGVIVHTPPQPDANGLVHAMELDSGRWIDGRGKENIARHANHSCEPNTESVPEGDVIELLALRDIHAGEEITFDYGYNLCDALSHPCRCGAKGCPGRIVATPLRTGIWKHFRIGRARD